MSNRKTLKRFSMAALPLFFATGTLAVNAQEQELEIDEVLVVTGFRQSLSSAVDAKREAKNITDNIYAEDIGKSSDQNIAEALSRVTGISLNRTDGEGTSVSIRGAAPNLNNISLNGVALTSGSNPGASGPNASQDVVDLSAFSSDILSRVEVYKTASADLDEGSLGGSVVLHTFRPLDAAKNRKVLEFQPRYSSYGDEVDYKLSGGISHKFLDETFGIHATLFSETQTVFREQVQGGRLKEESHAFSNVRDQHGNIMTAGDADKDGNIKGLAFDQLSYRDYQNDRARIGGTLGLQFAPSDDIDMQFDLTHSTQTVRTDDNSFVISSPKDEEFTPQALGQRYGGKVDWISGTGTDANPWVVDSNAIPEKSDPLQDWTVYNTNTGFFTKRLGRYALTGSTAREISEVETDNTIASFDYEHRVEDFTFNFKAGYSKTTSDDLINAGIKSNDSRTNKNIMLAGVSSDDIQPIGYDCTTGKCKLIAGTALVDPGPDGDIFTTADNTSLTAVNPDDINAYHLQFATTRDQSVSDESKSLFFDVDWEVDAGWFTTLETGLKWSDREKENIHGFIQYNQDGQSGGTGKLQTPIEDILVKDIQAGTAGSGGFLSGLGYAQDNITDGWPSMDAEKAFKLLGMNETNSSVDISNTRKMGVEARSAYLKANFEVFSGSGFGERLYGDVGIRYVNTQNESSGYSGIKYINSGILDLDTLRLITDKSQAPCNYHTLSGITDPANIDPNIAFDKNNDFTKKLRADREAELAQGACFDVLLDNRVAGDDWGIWPVDKTVNDPSKNPVFPVTGSGSSNILLPSLNLNYEFTSDLIARFAISKTMARPTMDSLRPGFKFSENVWSGIGNGNLANPDLKPLESKNLDLGVEWYFNDNGGLLSATYFRKDYTNFEDTENVTAYLKDVRGEDLSAGGTISDFIQFKEDSATCFPNRPNLWNGPWLNPDARFDNACHEFQITRTINGSGATVNGLELGYSQNYDFLPSVWSGLGTSLNVTLQETETEAQEGTKKGTKLPALPLAYSPEQSFNATVFWEYDSHLIRLAYNHATDVLVNRSWQNGMALWQEGGGTLDLSANLQLSNSFSITFNAVNLTDKVTRLYATNVSNSLLNNVLKQTNGEGSAFDGATKERTITEYTTGVVYRVGLRYAF